MLLLTNHLGYEALGPKQAVLMTNHALETLPTARLVCAQSHQTLATYQTEPGGTVDRWHQGHFFRIPFSNFDQIGQFYLAIDKLNKDTLKNDTSRENELSTGDSVRSHTFEIRHQHLLSATLSDVLHYFKSQRCAGVFDQQDRHVPLYGHDAYADVHGGWYDASGDVSKYLSHLSYANYFNPQQIPMVVWNLFNGLEQLQTLDSVPAFTRLRMTEEALHGADFLVRMQHPDGYFYMTVFDQWSKETSKRHICAYATQLGHKSSDFQAGFRQGGGIAIAALAAAAQREQGGQYRPNDYLAAAEKGYWHLISHNREYLNDGVENIIDEYCALLASCELYRATKQTRYLQQSQEWANKLMARQCSDDEQRHFWSANHDGSRPYFHASDAGLPVISLCRYLDIETDAAQRDSVQRVIEQAVRFELAITQAVHNPFGYPRQYTKPLSEEKSARFFVPHDNETGYWWQGENARLGSLASMAHIAQRHIDNSALCQQLDSFAEDCLSWILGLNPFDLCMLDGAGHNNPDYLPELGFFNAKGGICNGITSGFDDERDIAFNPSPQCEDMLQNWRWGEQWIPHAAWYLLAICHQARRFSQTHPFSKEQAQ